MTILRRFKSFIPTVCALLGALYIASGIALASKVVTLSLPNGLPANGSVPFSVVGDRLGTVHLKVWRVTEPQTNRPQHKEQLVYEGNSARRSGHDEVTLYAPLRQQGFYLAEAQSGPAVHADFFRLVEVTGPTISVSAPGQCIPGDKIPFTISSTGFTLNNADLRVWRMQGADEKQQRLVLSTSGKRKADEQAVALQVPLRHNGLYLAEAYSHGLHANVTLRVCDLGLVAKRAPGELLVYAVRVTSGQPMPGTAIRLDDCGEATTDDQGRQVWARKPGPARSVIAGSDGVAHFGTTPRGGLLRAIGATADDSRAQCDIPIDSGQESDLKVLFYTERPIYRPGQLVHFKGIVRRDLTLTGARIQGAQYQPVRNYPVKIEFTDARSMKIDTLTLHTNAMGSFAGDTQLDGEAPVGFYTATLSLLPINAQADAQPVNFYGRFSVQEYRKPEFEVTATPLLDPARPWAPQGTPFKVRVSAQYYFGGPVKHGKLSVTNGANHLVLDDKGEATIDIWNPVNEPSHSDITHQLHFQVVDDSNRAVDTDLTVFAPWSQVKPTLAPSRNVYKLRETAQLDVRTRDPIGRPVSGTAVVHLYYYRHRQVKNPETLQIEDYDDETEFWNATLKTGDNGRALADVKLGRAGYIKAEISAQDENGREEHYTTNFWVTSPEVREYYGYQFPAVSLIVDTPEVAPGAMVHALILSDDPDATALVTLEGDRIFLNRTIPLHSNATPLEFAFPAAATPGAHLEVGIVSNNQWVSDSSYIKSLDPAQRLDIGITPSKPQYRPGETAHYTIQARDGLGHPQRAEISLSFVDKALYALAQDETPDLTEFYYGSRPDRVATAWFLPQELEGGSFQHIEPAVPVRHKFEDTAYWNPFVVTGADGDADIDFTLPDNLTTWRATARGITSDTRVGQATQETLVTKPLLVRLTLPRYIVEGDNVQGEVILQNNTPLHQSLRVSMRAIGAELTAGGDITQGAQTDSVEPFGSAQFFWNLSAASIPQGGTASFTATARGDAATPLADNSDALQLSIPVIPHGLPVRNWATGALTNESTATTTLKQPDQTIANAGRLEIKLSPSLAGPVLGALPELQGFPYGCTEQTLERFVPAVVAAQALKKLGKPLPASMKDLPKQVKQGIAILTGYQHQDGGWGWWKEDDTDPYMTAYAVYGLSLALRAGYDVDRGMLLGGARSIMAQFSQDAQLRARYGAQPGMPTGYEIGLTIKPDTRAFMMLGYVNAIVAAHAVPGELGRDDDYLGAVFGVRDKLSNYGLASLALAFAQARHSGQRTQFVNGIAMLHYLSKMHENAQGDGLNGKYTLSANGDTLYYRDRHSHKLVEVPVPPQGVQLAESVAAQWSQYPGYRAQAVPGQIEGIGADPANLKTLVQLLESRAVTSNLPGGTGTWWTNGSDAHDWRDSDVETTAIALQALLETDPNSPLVTNAVRWLMGQRQGSLWVTTKDSAQAVIALTDYLARYPELDPDETIHVLVNGQERKAIHFTAAAIGEPDAKLRLDEWNDDANIQFVREGHGALYYSALLASYTRAGLDVPENNGIQIERHYAVRNAEGHWRDIGGPIPNGGLVRVELRITIDKTYQYLLLEDPLPAGFEVRDSDDSLAWVTEYQRDATCPCRDVVLDPPPGWQRFPETRRETHDDRASFFASYLPATGDSPNPVAGMTHYMVRYILRPESSGVRTALPAHIETMYQPELNGRTAQDGLQVK